MWGDIMSKARVICFANQKGGVGKTMSVSATASILTNLGQKVLMIDQDAQRNLDMVAGKGLMAELQGVPNLAISRSDEDSLSILNVLDGDCDIKDAIVSSEIGDLVRSTNKLYGWVGPELLSFQKASELLANPEKSKEDLFDYVSARMNDPNLKDKNFILEKKIQPILEEYDYILIDTNPTLTLLTMNSLYASQFVVIPAFSETSSLEAAVELWETIQGIKYFSPWRKLEIVGILRTKQEKNTNASKRFHEAYAYLSEQINIPLFQTSVRKSAKAAEYVEAKMDIVRIDPHCNTALDYMSFVDELLLGMEQIEERWNQS